MKQRRFIYILSVLLFLCGLVSGPAESYAQRARNHRLGLMKADSTHVSALADSLSSDTSTVQRTQRLEALEAPVDTAVLARQNDSVQTTMPKKKKRWIQRNRSGWDWLFRVPDRFITGNTGNCLLFTGALWGVLML